MISPAVVKATAGGTMRYGLDVDNLQEGIQISDDAISGKLKQVEEYPQFGDEKASELGHYLALDIEVPEGETATTKIEGGTKPDYRQQLSEDQSKDSEGRGRSRKDL